MTRPPARRIVALALVLGSGLMPTSTMAATPVAVRPASTPVAVRPVSPGVVRSTRPAVVSPAATRHDVTPPPALQPTIHYEDALAHADDRIRFRPGGAVTVPFRPRPGDRWLVGGVTPRPLPAGRLSGRAMRATDTSPGAPLAPVDQPTLDPATVLVADGVRFEPVPDVPRFDPTAAVDPGALRREVFGFLPYWELTDSSTRLDWDKISTIAYFGVGADSKGNLIKRNADGSTTVGWSGWTSSRMTSVIDAAHESHARVVLTVQSFAWSSTGLKRQKALLDSASARANLAHQIARAIRDRGADGVNLDFEPIASGYADEFTALVRKVRAVLDRTVPGYQLTFDTTGWIGNYPIEAATAKGGADAIVIMGYDYRASGSARVGSIAPIGGATYDIADTLRAYTARVPASKLILGVPYYGRAWSTSSDKLGARNISGTRFGASVAVMYATARDFAREHGKRYDATEGVAWTAYQRKHCTTAHGCVKPWRQLYFDDAKAIRAKYDLINRLDLRGAAIWALGYDDDRPELYRAIQDRFITDAVPPDITAASLSPTAFSPDGDGHADTATASLTATGLITWGYTVKPLAGDKAGKTIRSGSVSGRTPRFTWDGRDADGDRVKDGSYRVTLWTADISNNRAERAFTVIVDTKAASIAPTMGAGFLTPDGDGRHDTIALAWTSSEAVSGRVRLRDRAGRTVRAWTIGPRASWDAAWNGRATGGTIVPDGRYTFRVSGHDHAGNRTVVERRVIVDRTIADVRWSDRAFDPRATERSRMEIVLRRTATLAVVIERAGVVVRTVWTARDRDAGTAGWTWDGRDGAGKLVKPGRYRVVVTATSRIGTTRFTRPVTVSDH